MFFSLSFPTLAKTHKGRKLCLYSLMYPKHLEQCRTYSIHSINIFQIDEWKSVGKVMQWKSLGFEKAILSSNTNSPLSSWVRLGELQHTLKLQRPQLWKYKQWCHCKSYTWSALCDLGFIGVVIDIISIFFYKIKHTVLYFFKPCSISQKYSLHN